MIFIPGVINVIDRVIISCDIVLTGIKSFNRISSHVVSALAFSIMKSMVIISGGVHTQTLCVNWS